MKRKVLVVAGTPLSAAVTQVLRIFGEVEVATAAHGDALKAFFREQPTHTLVFDYEEKADVGEGRGAQDYRILAESVSGDQKIFRIGWRDYPYPDYIRLPQLAAALAERVFAE